MKRIFFIGFLTLMLMKVSAQVQVRYDVEPIVDSVENSYENAWKSVDYIDGYRIQLAAVSTKNGAQKVYDEFMLSYPQMYAYLSYLEPTFRVRVGNFKTRMEAYKFLLQVRVQFPGAFITKDKISFRDI